jgi:hypothetical protein
MLPPMTDGDFRVCLLINFNMVQFEDEIVRGFIAYS